jgi:hypothetical protein
MSTGSGNRLEMNIMWILMGIMFISELSMLYFHLAMHKRLTKLEERLSGQK